jgi:hypothetical protein
MGFSSVHKISKTGVSSSNNVLVPLKILSKLNWYSSSKLSGIFVKKISFLHKSISDFLTDQSRNHLHFFIHKENGHKLFADYLFKTLNISTTLQDNIAELISTAFTSFKFVNVNTNSDV